MLRSFEFDKKFLKPSKVRLEFSTLCQLNCRDCYMRKGNYCGLGKGYLTFENFKKFLDMNPFVKSIETSNSGEIFLNPDLRQILKYAFEKKVSLTAYNGVNLNYLPDELAEDLVKYHFIGMTVSIDGSSNEVYQQYRRNGNFNTVIRHIKKIQYYKSKYHTEYPEIRWQYIIMDTTEDIEEIERAKFIATELGIDIFFKPTWDRTFYPKAPGLIEKATGIKFQKRNLA